MKSDLSALSVASRQPPCWSREESLSCEKSDAAVTVCCDRMMYGADCVGAEVYSRSLLLVL